MSLWPYVCVCINVCIWFIGVKWIMLLILFKYNKSNNVTFLKIKWRHFILFFLFSITSSVDNYVIGKLLSFFPFSSHLIAMKIKQKKIWHEKNLKTAASDFWFSNPKTVFFSADDKSISTLSKERIHRCFSSAVAFVSL